MLSNWLKRLTGRKASNRQGRLLADQPRWKRVRLYAERLEDRLTPAQFNPGDVFATGTSPYALVNVTGGGDFAGTTPFATLPTDSPGQVAWSQDLQTAYVSEFFANDVLAVSATGAVSVFATGIARPDGLLHTGDGRLLVTGLNNGAVYDITAGGNFSSATPFATGLSAPEGLLQLPNGHLLVAEANGNAVMDITGGGNFAGATPFASGITFPQYLARSAAGHLFVNSLSGHAVYDITAGGNFTSATPFATGQEFSGLAVDGAGRLLAQSGNGNGVYDITSGGDFSSAAPFASNLPYGEGNSLNAVPDPVPQVSLTQISQTVFQNAGTVSVTAKLSGVSGLDTTVPFQVTGTARQGIDYTISPASLVIPAGSLTASATVTIINPNGPEPTRNIVIGLSPPTNAVLATNAGAPTQETIVLKNNVVPTVGFTSIGQTAFEPEAGSSTVTLTAKLSAASFENVVVPLTLAGSSTALASQHTQLPSQIVIPAGSLTGQATFSILDDHVAEPDKKINLVMGTPPNDGQGNPTAQLAGVTTFQVTIPANESPLVSFANSGQTVFEDVGTITVPIQLSNASSQTVTVPLVATPNTGFTFVGSSTVTIPAGGTTGSVQLRITDNGTNAPNENVSLAFGTVTNAGVNKYGFTTTKIAITNVHPLVSFTTSSQSVNENGGSFTVTAQLSQVTDKDVHVSLATSGSATSGVNYTLPSSAIVIQAGHTTGQVTVNLLDKGTAGPNTSLVLTMGSPVNGIIQGTPKETVTIVNTHSESVQFTGTTSFSGSPGASATITAKLSTAAGVAITVPLSFSGAAKNGTDYTAPASIVFPAGQTTWTGTITLKKNPVYQPSRQYTITMGTPSLGSLGSHKTFTGTVFGPIFFDSGSFTTVINPVYYAPPTAGTITIPPVAATLPPATLGPQIPFVGGVPTTPIAGTFNFSAPGGYIVGATAFFDANKNGILDPGEPSTTTGADGYFSLPVPPSFDTNQNGAIDPSEGQFVVVGGEDMATLLPQAGPLVAAPGDYVISPLSTLTALLVNSQGLDLSTGAQQVSQAFNLPAVDLTAFDPEEQVLNGNADAFPVYTTITKLENSIREMTDLVAAAPGAPPSDAVALAVVNNFAAAIAAPGATLDLNDPVPLGAIIQGILDDTGTTLDPSVVSAAASIIAAGNQQIDTVPQTGDLTYLTAVTQIQVVAQGTVAQQLADLAGGTEDAATVTQNCTNAFQTQVASAPTGNVVPPVIQISDVQQNEPTSGQAEFDFTVSLSAPSVLPVSVDYTTFDNTASAADGDYVPTFGTLTWAPGDATSRTIHVLVNGNSSFGPDKSFVVLLSNDVNAIARKPLGLGVIGNDNAFNYIPPGNGVANALDLQVNGDELTLTRNGQTVFDGSATLPSPISITGANGVRNTLDVDLLGDSVLPGQGVVFQGGNLGTDVLTINDGNSTSAEHTITGQNTGTFTIDGSTVQYGNVGSATDSLTPVVSGLPTQVVTSEPLSLTTSAPDPAAAALYTFAWTVSFNNSTVASGSDTSLEFTPALPGMYQITLVASAPGKGTGTTVETFSVGLQVPSVPALDPGSDTGAVGDGVTEDAAPTIDGTALPGSGITLFDNSTGSPVVIGTGTADGNGNWQVQVGTLSAGVHGITAQAASNGFTSAMSTAANITILTPLTYSASTNPGVTSYSLRYDASNGDYELIDPNNPSVPLASLPKAYTTSINITGHSGGTDTLTLDFSNGYFSVPGGITVDGGGTIPGVNGGTLNIVGGSFSQITDTLTGPGAGNFLLHPSTGSDMTVNYSGLLPVLLNQNAPSTTDLKFILPAGVTDATLSAGPAGQETLSSASNAFEATTFDDPSGSLTIDAAAGAATALTIDALNSSFTASLDVDLTGNTSGTSTISLANSLQVSSATAASNVAFTAQQINLGAGISTVFLTNAGSVTLTGNTTVTANAQISYGGAGGLSIGTPADTLTLDSSTTLTLTDTTSTDTGTIASQITGDGALAESGPGTLTLSNTGNLYTGGTTIGGGTLNVSADGALGATSGAISFTGNGTLQAGATTVTLDAARGLSIGNGVTATLDSNGNAFTVNGVISGTGGALTATGPGTVTLGNASNSYSGGTTITGGATLAISSDGDLGAVPAAPATNITINNGTLQANGNVSLSGNRSISLTGAAELDSQPAGKTLTLNGLIDGANGLTLAGSGEIDLKGAIGSHTAVTSLTTTAQFVRFTTGVNVGSGGASIGSNEFDGGASVTSVGGITLNSTLETAGGASPTFTSSSGTVALDGGADLGVGTSLTLAADTITVSNSTLHTYGNSTVTVKPASPGHSVAVGDNADAGADLQLSSTLLGEFATLAVSGLTIGSSSQTGKITVAASGNPLSVSVPLTILSPGSGGQVVVNGALSDTGGAISLRAAAVNVNAGVSASGNLTLTADSMGYTAGTLSAGSNQVTLQPLTGGTTIDLGGSTNTLQISTSELGAITAGTVVIGNGSAGNINVSAQVGAPADWNTLNLVTGANVTTSASSPALTVTNLGVTAPSGIGTAASPLTFSGLSALTTDSSGSNGNQFLSSTGTATISSLTAGSGTIDLAGGTFNLSANNQVNASSALQVDGGTFGISTFNDTVATLILNGGTVSGTTGVLTSTAAIDGRSGLASAILAGTNGLTKTTGGTLILTGASTYSGSTTVSDGTLQVDGSLTATAAVSVGSGATLGGTGTINSAATVSVQNGGHLAPGDSPGILNTGSLSFSSGGSFDVQIGGNTAGDGAGHYDQDNVTGTVSLGGATLNLSAYPSVTSYVPQAGDEYILIKNDGSDAVSGTFVAGAGMSATGTLAEGTLLDSNFLGSGLAAYLTYQGGDGNDVAIVVAGQISAAGTEFTVKENGGSIQILDGNGAVLDSRPVSSVTQINVTGVNSAANQLTIDYTGGFFAIPVSYTGGTGTGSSNSLSVTGGTFANITDNATGTGAGSLVFHPAAGSDATITYSNLTPISVTSTSTDVTINLPAGTPDAVLENSGTSGMEKISATGGSFESMTFNDPSGGTLYVNGTSGAAEALTINALNTSFANSGDSLDVDLQGNSGTGTDLVTVSGALSLAGSLTINSQTTDLNNTVSGASSVSGNASTVNVTAPGTIQTGIDLAGAGATVNVAAGTYTENVVVNKKITLTGAGDGTSPATNTILTSAAPSTPVLQVAAGGNSATDRLVISKLRVTGATVGTGNNGNGISITGGSGYLTFDSVTVANNSGNGIAIDSTNAFSDIKILNSVIDSNGGVGIRVPSSVASLDGLTVDGTTVSNNGLEGLVTNPSGTSNRTITNITISNSGFSGNNTSSSANTHSIDLFAFRGNLDLETVTVAHSAPGDAIQIDGRNQSGTAGTMTFNGVTVTGSPGKGGIVIQGFADQDLSTKLSFTNVDLSGVTPGTGWAALAIEQGGPGLVNLGNTKFKALGAGSPAALAMWGAGGADANSAVFVDGSGNPVTDNFTIADSITDAVDDASLGFVRVVAGNVYVTPNSFLSPATSAADIQRGITAATAGDTVNVQAGTYTGSVTVGKALALVGAGPTSIINAAGLATGLHITASNVSVSGFTIQGDSATGQGVWIDASGGSLDSDSVTDLVITGGATNIANDGIRVDRGNTANAITHLTVTGNAISHVGASPGYGLFLDGVTGGTYSNNSFANLANAAGYPSASQPAGIAISTASVGVYVQNSSGVNIDNTNSYSDLTLAAYFAPTTTGSTFSGAAANFTNVGGYYVNGNSLSDSMSVSGLTQSVTTSDVAAGTGANFSPLGGVPNLFAKIQTAIDFSAAAATVTATAGTYAENVNVYKSLTVQGPNATINPVTGTRMLEAVVEPGLTSDYNSDSVFTVEASNVTIAGFTIQGSITGTAPFGQSAYFSLDSGVKVYAAAGISNSANYNTGGPPLSPTSPPSSTVNVSGLTVENNVLQDFTQVGVYGDTNDGTVSTGNTIADNVIKDVPNNGNGGFYGEGVIIYDNFYADITGNKLTKVRTGIQTGNNSLSAGLFAPSISTNIVSAYVKGIYFNLQYASASAFTVNDNIITQANGAVSPAYNVGLLVQSIQGSVQETIQRNNVSGFLYGVEFAGNNTTSPVTVKGGTLDHNTYGVWDTNNDYFYPANYNTTAALDGVTITNSAVAGVWVDSTSANSSAQFNTTNSTTLTITDGTTVSGGTAGVLIEGTLSSAGIQQSSITGNTTGVEVTGGGQLTGVSQSFINGNVTGIDLAGDAGTVGAIFGNDLSANSASAINNGTSVLVNASGNWWGSNTRTNVQGAFSGSVDYTPFLNSGTDTDAGTRGFQGDFSYLNVDAQSPQFGATGRIQEGINDVTTGGTVNVLNGTYTENVVIGNYLSLVGAGSGSDPASNTIIQSATANTPVIVVTGSGLDTTHRLLIQDVRITGATGAGNLGAGVRIDGPSAGHVELNGVDVANNGGYGIALNTTSAVSDLVIQGSTSEGNADGFRMGTGASLDGLTISGSTFQNNDYGIEVYAASSGSTSLTNVHVSNTQFLNNVYKGAYFEKLNNATFTNITVTDNGTGASSPAGFDLNLKYAAYSNINFDGATFTDNGTGAADGVGLTIKGRDDGSYSSTPATVTTIGLTNVSVTGSPIDLAIGNQVSGLTFSGVSLAGTGTGLVYYADAADTPDLADTSFASALGTYIVNQSANNVTATNATFGGHTGMTATLAQNFAIEDKITHAVDDASLGFVRVEAGYVFVTVNSFNSPSTTAPDIQRGIDAATAGDTVNVAAGTYTNNLAIGKSLSLVGAGSTSTTVNAHGGVGVGLSGASNVVVLQGLSITNGSAAIDSTGVTTLTLSDVSSSGNTAGGTFAGTTGTVNLTALAGATVSADAAAQTFGTDSLQAISYAGGTLTHLNLGTLGNGNTFDVKPKTGQTTAIAVDGGTPFEPGSTLSLDLSAVSSPTVNVSGPGAGSLSTSPAANALSWSHIGTLTSSPAVPVAIPATPGDKYRVFRSGTDLEVDDVTSIPFMVFNATYTSVTTLTITGSGAGANEVNVDFAGATEPIPSGGIAFDGVAGTNNVLKITNGTFTTLTSSYTGADVGSVTPDSLGVISYTGLALLQSPSTAQNAVFDLPSSFSGGPTFNAAELADSGVTPTPLQLSSNNGTFVQTQFTNPGSLLTVHRGTANDTLATAALTALTAGLTAGSTSKPFAAITVNNALSLSTGTASLALNAGTINLNAGVTTTNTQDYQGAVSLGTNATLTGSTVTFESTVSGATHSLEVDGAAVFGGAVTGLTTLTVTGTAAINTGTVSSGGAQDYKGAVTLGADATLMGSTVTFEQTVAGATHSLEVDGAAVFGGAVTGLTALTVTGAAQINTGTVSGSGAQDYQQGVTLGADATLTASTVTFGAALDDATASAHALTVTGAAVFNGPVGGARALAALAVSGTTTLNAGAVMTGGKQSYDGAFTLGADAVLTAGGDVTFGATVDGANSLTVAAGTGNVTFVGAVGDAPLTSLTIASAANVSASAAVTAGAITQTAGSGTSTFGGPLHATGAGGISLTGSNFTITGGLTVDAGPLALNASGTATVTGGPVNLGGNTLTASGSGATTIASGVGGSGGLVMNGSGSLALTGTDTYTGATTIAQGVLLVNGVLATGGAAVSVNGGTLGGTGNIRRAVLVNSGGTLAPGSGGPGQLSTDDVTFAPGSDYAVDLNGAAAGTGYDQLNVTGAVTLDNAALVLAGGFNAAPGTVLTLIANDGTDAVAPAFAGLPEGATVSVGGLTGILSYVGGDGNDVTLTVTGGTTFGGGDNYVLRRSGDSLQLVEDGALVDSRPLAAVTDFTVTPGAPSGSLTVDFGFGGFFALPGAVQFLGGAGAGLSFTGGSFPAVAETQTGPAAGGVSYSDGTATLQVNYSGTRAVDLTATAITSLSFRLPDSDDQAVLQDNGSAAHSSLNSGNGTFAMTTYIDPSASLSLNAGGGNDAVTVRRTAAGTPQLFVDGGAGSNSLDVDLSAYTHPDAVFLTGTAIHSVGLAATVFYQASGGTFAGGVHLETGPGGDFLALQGTAAHAPTSVTAGAGNDLVVVSSDPGLIHGTLDGFKSPLTVDAGGGSNHLVVSEMGRPTGDFVWITAQAIASGATGAAIFYRAGGGSFGQGIDVATGSGDDTIILQGQPAGAPLHVYGGAGNDAFVAAVTSASAYRGVALDGGAGVNLLSVYDGTGGAVMHDEPFAAGAGVVMVSYLGGQDSQITYTAMQGHSVSVDADASYIQQLFHDVLGMTATAADLALWQTVLDQGGRGAVAGLIEQSLPARERLVTQWYQQYLGAAPDAQSELFWAGRLSQESEEAVLADFLGSPGYYLLAGDTDAAFVYRLYQDLLDRQPSADELGSALAWLQTLPRSVYVGQLLTGLEYRERTVAMRYAELLRTNATAADLALWGESGLSQQALDFFFETGDAYFNFG